MANEPRPIKVNFSVAGGAHFGRKRHPQGIPVRVERWRRKVIPVLAVIAGAFGEDGVFRPFDEGLPAVTAFNTRPAFVRPSTLLDRGFPAEVDQPRGS